MCARGSRTSNATQLCVAFAGSEDKSRSVVSFGLSGTDALPTTLARSNRVSKDLLAIEGPSSFGRSCDSVRVGSVESTVPVLSHSKGNVCSAGALSPALGAFAKNWNDRCRWRSTTWQLASPLAENSVGVQSGLRGPETPEGVPSATDVPGHAPA